MIQATRGGQNRGEDLHILEGIGLDYYSLWESVGHIAPSAPTDRHASVSTEMAVRSVEPGGERQGGGSMDTVVRRLVAEKHQDHFDHFVLETKIVEAGVSLGVEVESYPNLHVHRHHVWVSCQCGKLLLLE
jgi:hypothetical protein